MSYDVLLVFVDVGEFRAFAMAVEGISNEELIALYDINSDDRKPLNTTEGVYDMLIGMFYPSRPESQYVAPKPVMGVQFRKATSDTIGKAKVTPFIPVSAASTIGSFRLNHLTFQFLVEATRGIKEVMSREFAGSARMITLAINNAESRVGVKFIPPVE